MLWDSVVGWKWNWLTGSFLAHLFLVTPRLRATVFKGYPRPVSPHIRAPGAPHQGHSHLIQNHTGSLPQTRREVLSATSSQGELSPLRDSEGILFIIIWNIDVLFPLAG